MSPEDQALAIELLRKFEWEGCNQVPYDGCDPACPECHGDYPTTLHIPARRIDAYTREEARDVPRGGHEPGCRYGALLDRLGRE